MNQIKRVEAFFTATSNFTASRPYGVQLLLTGWSTDNDKPEIFLTEPSGMLSLSSLSFSSRLMIGRRVFFE